MIESANKRVARNCGLQNILDRQLEFWGRKDCFVLRLIAWQHSGIESNNVHDHLVVSFSFVALGGNLGLPGDV